MTVTPAVQRKESQGDGGVFSGCVFALSLGHATFETKANLRKKITSNGGVISYLVTSKCNFLITCDASSSSTAVSERTASKFGIPVVDPSYVDDCLSAGALVRIQTVAAAKQMQAKVSHEFGKGNIVVGNGAESKTTNLSSNGSSSFDSRNKLKAWTFLDPDGPRFHQQDYTVAKFSCLQGRPLANGESQFCVLEIHVMTQPKEDDQFRYCVFQHLETIGNHAENQTKKRKGSSRLCYFTNTGSVALATFSKLHSTLHNPPHSMSKWRRHSPIPLHVGSPEFHKIRELWVTSLGHIDARVVALLDDVWYEAVGQLDRVLTVKPDGLSLAQLDKCEALLLEIRKTLDQESGPNESLTNDYYRILPQPGCPPLNCKKELVRQHELLQLIRDVVTVSEPGTDVDEDMSTVAKYRAINCHIAHLDPNSREFAAVREKVEANGNNTVEIANVFALRRPQEETTFVHSLDNRQILFHATRACNLVGILSRGLLPPKIIGEEKGEEALGPGHLGSGIYFSDSPDASLEYCGDSGPRLMLLAQVALGKTFQATGRMPELIAPPHGHDSVIRRHPASDKQPESVEYVVYRPEQYRIVYLIELVSDFRNKVPRPIKTTSKKPDSWFINVNASDDKSVIRAALEDILAEKDAQNAVPWGLRCSGNRSVALRSVHVRVTIADLAARVVLMQEYVNEHDCAMEANYVMPLDELSAVCGFEAHINGKHVIGQVQEKDTARATYRQAISQGHGAYLMDEIAPDSFKVSVGNLPAKARVLIKITYVTELTTEAEKILFRLPGFAKRKLSAGSTLSFQNNATTSESVAVSGDSIANYSLEASVTMPFLIRAITCHTHQIQVKRTDHIATVRLASDERIEDEFQLLIDLAEIHVPRMWVEEQQDGSGEASMLTFFPSFDESSHAHSGTLTLLLDASHSMRGDAFHDAKCLALLCLHFLDTSWSFNVVLFGSTFEELFPVPMIKSQENMVLAETFIMEAQADLGCTDVAQALRPLHLMSCDEEQDAHNVFLITDGHLNNVGELLRQMIRHASGGTRLFTLGVGTCNRHLLRLLATKGAGVCEYFDRKLRAKWGGKVRTQVQRAAQPMIRDVHVEWQQLDALPETIIQAPRHLSPIFSGTRLVVYGFVPHCTVATLSARIGNENMSTVVSTSELSKTRGRMLHVMTARAVIRDWEDGVMHENAVENEALKSSMKSYIVNLSRQYGLVSSLTSYVAVEERSEPHMDGESGPTIDQIVGRETVDQLQYMGYPELSQPISLPFPHVPTENDDQPKMRKMIKYQDKRRAMFDSSINRLRNLSTSATAQLSSIQQHSVSDYVLDSTTDQSDIDFSFAKTKKKNKKVNGPESDAEEPLMRTSQAFSLNHREELEVKHCGSSPRGEGLAFCSAAAKVRDDAEIIVDRVMAQIADDNFQQMSLHALPTIKGMPPPLRLCPPAPPTLTGNNPAPVLCSSRPPPPQLLARKTHYLTAKTESYGLSNFETLGGTSFSPPPPPPPLGLCPPASGNNPAPVLCSSRPPPPPPQLLARKTHYLTAKTKSSGLSNFETLGDTSLPPPSPPPMPQSPARRPPQVSTEKVTPESITFDFNSPELRKVEVSRPPAMPLPEMPQQSFRQISAGSQAVSCMKAQHQPGDRQFGTLHSEDDLLTREQSYDAPAPISNEETASSTECKYKRTQHQLKLLSEELGGDLFSEKVSDPARIEDLQQQLKLLTKELSQQKDCSNMQYLPQQETFDVASSQQTPPICELFGDIPTICEEDSSDSRSSSSCICEIDINALPPPLPLSSSDDDDDMGMGIFDGPPNAGKVRSKAQPSNETELTWNFSSDNLNDSAESSCSDSEDEHDQIPAVTCNSDSNAKEAHGSLKRAAPTFGFCYSKPEARAFSVTHSCALSSDVHESPSNDLVQLKSQSTESAEFNSTLQDDIDLIDVIFNDSIYFGEIPEIVPPSHRLQPEEIREIKYKELSKKSRVLSRSFRRRRIMEQRETESEMLERLAYETVGNSSIEDDDETNNRTTEPSASITPPLQAPNVCASGLPLCTKVIDYLLSPSCQLIPLPMKALLKKGTSDNLKTGELSKIQEQISSIEIPFIIMNTSQPENWEFLNAILNKQLELGYFTMENFGTWVDDSNIVADLLKDLDTAGIKSLGGIQTTIMQLCATLLVLMVFWAGGSLQEPSFDLTPETIESELRRFPSFQLQKVVKALIFVRWADSQNPLSCRVLQLGSNWETFLISFLLAHQ